jgi:anaerobic selenocysteine-containing dehydrogenase
MLGMAYVLETEGLAASDFLQSHCVGYPKVKDYVWEQATEWPSRLIGLPPSVA